MLVHWNGFYCSLNDEIEIDMADAEGQPILQKQYVKIEVRNPRTHVSREKALYTDYEILVQTNNIAFASPESCVRRRYSDFQWLRSRLLSQYGLEKNLPELPPKRLFGRFKRAFLKHRQKGLQRFLEDITSEPTFLSDVSVHLFLQSSLSIKQISSKLNGTDSGGELIEMLQSPCTLRGRGLSRSSSQIDSINEVNFEHDSGFSYSTASSITDGATSYFSPHKPCNGNLFAPAVDHEKQSNKSRNGFCCPEQKIENNVCHTDSQQTYHIENHLLTSSEDETYSSQQYDADDETDQEKFEENNNCSSPQCTYRDSEDGERADDDELFCFCQDNQGTIYSLERAFQIIKTRPKLSSRLYSQDDSDDCFHESEYDVIDTEDDFDTCSVVNEETYPKAVIPHIKVRSNSYSEGNQISQSFLKKSKNKLKTGKVKSLPNIRFPIRNKKKGSVRRSLTYHGISDLRNETLKEVNEQEEQTSKDDHKKIDHMYLSPSKKVKSESEAQNMTSDADYLQTIHKYHSNESHADTNVDTQAEDQAPSKFYDFFKRRKRKQAPVGLSIRKTLHGEGQTGRFHVSSVLDDQNNSRYISSNLTSNPTNTPKVECSASEQYDIIDGVSGMLPVEKQHCCEENVTGIATVIQIDVCDACVTLCRCDCSYSTLYRNNSKELTLTEEVVPLRKISDVNKKSIVEWKSYEIINA